MDRRTTLLPVCVISISGDLGHSIIVTSKEAAVMLPVNMTDHAYIIAKVLDTKLPPLVNYCDSFVRSSLIGLCFMSNNPILNSKKYIYFFLNSIFQVSFIFIMLLYCSSIFKFIFPHNSIISVKNKNKKQNQAMTLHSKRESYLQQYQS